MREPSVDPYFNVIPKSISDDDLCATCTNLEYRPGELSRCRLHWPGISDADGYIVECENYDCRKAAP